MEDIEKLESHIQNLLRVYSARNLKDHYTIMDTILKVLAVTKTVAQQVERFKVN
jgi:hypothetical protein